MVTCDKIGKISAVGWWCPIAVDCVKQFIVDDVKLWTDVVGSKISNQAHRRRVLVGETQELSLAGARVPFWEFLAVLDTWIKYVGRAAPHAETTKLSTWFLQPGKDFNGRQGGVFSGSVVVDPRGVVQCHGPQCRRETIRPVKVAMDHHGASHARHGLYGPFCAPILMVSADARNGVEWWWCLNPIGAERFLKGSTCEDAIVGVIATNGSTNLGGECFERKLGPNRVAASKGYLWIDENGS